MISTSMTGNRRESNIYLRPRTARRIMPNPARYISGKLENCRRLILIKESFAMKVAYDPTDRFEINVWDTEFRRTPTRTLMARVYQPNGAGPFPVLLDLHGGAWNNQDRKANAPMDESLASSGILVVAIDLTLAPKLPILPRCRTPTTACAGSNTKRASGTAIRKRSARWAAPAAGMWSSFAPCVRMTPITACIHSAKLRNLTPP